jgi:dihydroflavonol-4-reductase
MLTYLSTVQIEGDDMTDQKTGRVLVTGATGFVAGHCIAELLAHGYPVRATVRDLAATDRTAHLRALGGDLEFVAADLTSDAGWAEAVAGCADVLHVASPFPAADPKDENELIRPAVDGTLRVLRAAVAAGTVRRVVLTSSIAAIAGGHDRADTTVRTEADWSELATSPAYYRSKTLAERAAWDFVADNELELVVINPGMVFGPLQRAGDSTSLELLRRLLAHKVPGSPRLGFSAVDVRDLATAHRLALETPAAVGRRYICATDFLWLRDAAAVLAAEFNPQGYRVPTGGVPDFAIRLLALVDPTVKLAVYNLGRQERVSSARARADLGWTSRPIEQTLTDTGYSLIEHGLVPDHRTRNAAGASAGTAGAAGATAGTRR